MLSVRSITSLAVTTHSLRYFTALRYCVALHCETALRYCRGNQSGVGRRGRGYSSSIYKDHRDEIESPDPVVKDVISYTVIKLIKKHG